MFTGIPTRALVRVTTESCQQCMKRSIAVLEAEARSSRSKAASTGTTPRRTRTWPWASSARYKRTAALVKDLKAVLEEYGVTGHSLRGTLAQHVHDNVLEKMGRLVAFNPGATLLGPIPDRKSVV